MSLIPGLYPDAVSADAINDPPDPRLSAPATVRPPAVDLATKRLIAFDADGTLRRCTIPGQPCPNAPGEWEVIPGVKERIATLPDGMRFAIVSNQGGVGLGFVSEHVAWQMLVELADLTLRGQCVALMCTHSPKYGCLCRKPSPLMLYQAMIAFDAKPRETLYVGDMESDREAAHRAGIDFLWAWEFFGWPPVDGQAPGGQVRKKLPTLAELEAILAAEKAAIP